MIFGRSTALFSRFKRLQSIQSDPALSPETWWHVQPGRTISVFSREVLLTQPSSTFFVYLLGLQTIGVGGYFWYTRGHEISRLWWGISLVLWGIGALLAGTSYQAFGYQIKCKGRRYSTWTSWWEVVYLMFQQVSMDAMLAAVAYSCTAGTLRTALLIYAGVNAVGYVLFCMIGALLPVKSWITFSMMVWISTPIVLFFLLLNGWRYATFQAAQDLALLGAWLLLLLAGAAYAAYDRSGLTEKLWDGGKGAWFSQNDVLHVALILWMVYILAVLAGHVTDYAAPVLSGAP